MKNKNILIIAITIFTMAALMTGCGKKEVAKKEEVRVPVEVAKPVRGTVIQIYKTTGTVYAEEESNLGFPAGGRLIEIYVDEGDTVVAGQVLAKVDSVQLREAVNAAQAAYNAAMDGVEALGAALDVSKNQLTDAVNQYEKIEADYLRFKSLYEDEVITKKEFEDMETAYKSAELRVESAEDGVRAAELQVDVARGQADAAAARKDQASKALSDTVLKAPYAGIITEKMMGVGEQPGGGDSVFRLTGEGVRKVLLDIPEENHGKIAIGDTVNIVLEYLPGEVIAATVSTITLDVKPKSRTFNLEAVIPEEYDVLPGSFCEAELELGRAEDTMTIPMSAILSFEGQQVVFVNEGGVATRKNITTGIIEGETVQVVEGLDWEDEVVVVGNRFLNTGAKLDVQPSSEPGNS